MRVLSAPSLLQIGDSLGPVPVRIDGIEISGRDLGDGLCHVGWPASARILQRICSRQMNRSPFHRHVSEIPKSSAICLIVTPVSRRWATAPKSSGNSLGQGFAQAHILPEAPHGITGQDVTYPCSRPLSIPAMVDGARGRDDDSIVVRVLEREEFSTTAT